MPFSLVSKSCSSRVLYCRRATTPSKHRWWLTIFGTDCGQRCTWPQHNLRWTSISLKEVMHCHQRIAWLRMDVLHLQDSSRLSFYCFVPAKEWQLVSVLRASLRTPQESLSATSHFPVTECLCTDMQIGCSVLCKDKPMLSICPSMPLCMNRQSSPQGWKDDFGKSVLHPLAACVCSKWCSGLHANQ